LILKALKAQAIVGKRERNNSLHKNHTRTIDASRCRRTAGGRLATRAAALLMAVWPLLAQARPWPDSSDRIVVFADQLPESMSTQQRQFSASRLAGTQKMRVSEIRALRVYNADFLCLHYQLGLGCGAHPFIIGDEWASDWDYVNSRESFFVHNASSARVHQTAWNWDLMDITSSGGSFNTAFPEYWITSCLYRVALNENDGVFADSFTVDSYSFGQCNPSHEWLENIDLCRNNWIPSLQTYAAAIKNRFDADGRNFLFLPNLGALITSWDTTDYNRLGHGGMIESFCFWGNDSYLSAEDWALQMANINTLARSNQVLLCQSYIGAVANYRDRMFATASHLLIKGSRTYFFMLADEGLEYYPEYEITLGRALSGLPSDFNNLWHPAWGVYRRDYTNGIVLVNPGGTEAAISSLGSQYWLVSASGGGAVPSNGEYTGSLSYTAITSLTLAAHSGAILLASTNNPPPTPTPTPTGLGTPVIRANGETNEVSINHPGAASITVEMNAGESAGVEADWWALALAHGSGEWYYLDGSMQWHLFSGNLAECRPAYQGALFDLPAATILSGFILPRGGYSFYFGVDRRDGTLNAEGPIEYDSVYVVVQ